jgi:hypothetical protein
LAAATNKAARGAGKDVVGAAAAAADLIANLVGETEALLTDRVADGRALGDLLDQNPQLWALEEGVNDRLKDAGLNQCRRDPFDDPLAHQFAAQSINERSTQRGLN